MAKTDKQTHLFRDLWLWADRAQTIYSSSNRLSVTDIHDIQHTVLDIHAEGKLQNEIKDIIEELDILVFITERQKTVVKKFIQNTRRIREKQRSSNTESGLFQRPKMQDLDNHEWFETASSDLEWKVIRHVEELKMLKQSAEATSASVGTTALPSP